MNDSSKILLIAMEKIKGFGKSASIGVVLKSFVAAELSPNKTVLPDRYEVKNWWACHGKGIKISTFPCYCCVPGQDKMIVRI